MPATGFDLIDSPFGHVKMTTQLPANPEAYYGDRSSGRGNVWTGGEVLYHNGSGTGANKLYVQTATSGRTPTWRTTKAQWTT